MLNKYLSGFAILKGRKEAYGDENNLKEKI